MMEGGIAIASGKTSSTVSPESSFAYAWKVPSWRPPTGEGPKHPVNTCVQGCKSVHASGNWRGNCVAAAPVSYTA